MPAVHRGEVWMIDFGMVAKVRPALLLTDAQPRMNSMSSRSSFTPRRFVATSGSSRSPKPFLKLGAFHLQQIQTVSTVKLERKLGVLTPQEMKVINDALVRRLALYDSP